MATSAPAMADPVPGNEPLPGYTINNPPLAPILVGGVPTTVHQGVHEHAAYDIEIPPNWNGELVMWAHGFRGQGFLLTVGPPDYLMRQKLLNQGYAWAASSYYDNGYDIRAGVLSTHDLAELFASSVGRPHRTYIMGVSMGGHIIGRSLEQFPGFYAGALPMCGVLGDHELFDFFLDYNVVAQDLAGIPAWPVPADYLTNAGAADPSGAWPHGAHADRARHHQRSGQATAAHHGQPLRRASPGDAGRLRVLEELPLLDRHRRGRPDPGAGPGAACHERVHALHTRRARGRQQDLSNGYPHATGRSGSTRC
jgi:hypothetical protein